MTKSNKTPVEYWKERANLRMASYHKNSDKTILEIINCYDDAIKSVNKEIEKIFYNFSKDITKEEARRMLKQRISSKETLDKCRKIMQETEDPLIKRRMLARLNTNAYRARITRLEALKENLYFNIKKIADFEVNKSTKLYVEHVKRAYYKNIFDIQKGVRIEFNFGKISDKTIQEILNNKWSGKHYSERIWGNTEVLASNLKDSITNGLMAGKSYITMVKELNNITDAGKFACERLIRTETTYVTNMAEIESYKECKIDKYVFVATLDNRTSLICREHDGQVYDVKESIPGENLPPLHPHCRSTTVAYFDEKSLKSMKRRARDPKTGKNYVVDSNMNYSDWYQKYVINKYGPEETAALEKFTKNEASDKIQYKKYKEILGKEAPITFAKFQELKYNNVSEYEELKLLYRDVNWQVKAQENITKGSEHKVPFQSKPNSIFDNYKNGKLESRRYYGNTGKPRLDIDLSDHGNPAKHKTVPHQHYWLKDESNHDDVKRPKDLPLTKAQQIANKDIL